MQDRVPSTQLDRAKALGRLGARLSLLLGQAGARGLVCRGVERELLWAQTHHRAASALFEGLGQLRGAAAKLGQLLAWRPDLLPMPYSVAMFELSSRAPAMGYGVVETQVIRELARRPHELFANFERLPVAAASLGQVHRAALTDGTPVAVKIQYPAMAQSLDSDFRMLARLLRRHRGALDELREHLEHELDYRLEADNIGAFERSFADDPELRFPTVHRAFTTKRVLTMAHIEGVHIDELLAGGANDARRQRHARQLLRFGWRAAVEHGLLHADPNPGNYMFTDAGELAVLDFGCVKRLDAPLRAGLVRLIRALLNADADARDAALAVLGFEAPPHERRQLHALIELWARPFTNANFDFGDRRYLDELVDVHKLVGRKLDAGARLSIPPQLMLLGRHMLGQTYLLTRLGARGDFGQLLGPIVAERPAAEPRAAAPARACRLVAAHPPTPPRRSARPSTTRACRSLARS